MTPETNKLVYLSQSLADREWLNRLLQALAPYERERGLEIFSDLRSLPTEESWDQAREKILQSAVVAVMLLSRDCLNSRFLTQHEWPRIQAAVNAGLPLIVIPIQRTEIPEPDSREYNPRQHDRRDSQDLKRLLSWLNQDRHHWAGDHRLVLEKLSEGELANAIAQIALKIAMTAGVISQIEGERIPLSAQATGEATMTANAVIRPRRIRIPDIAWVEIPGGPFIYQEGETRQLPTFWIAKYPITNMQYQCFIDDGGYTDKRWWRGLKRPEPTESRRKQPNRPRTDVDWREAVAFSRWLCTRLGVREGGIRLPMEEEWERAARGPEGLAYPWGAEYRSGYANVDEMKTQAGTWHLEQTTAVGVYPHGQSSEGVEDMAGMVWEWCLNKHDKPEQTETDGSNDRRVVRGGSWIDNPDLAHAEFRDWFRPDDRYNVVGFRLLSSSPISSAGR